MGDGRADFTAVSANHYTFEQLASIYNESRVDYIVPMPMNAKRMEEYVLQYDIDLGLSVVALNQDGQVAGVGMLGMRGNRAWITRLGVIPTRRGRGIGQFIVEHLLENAREGGAVRAQLEVIEGNEPALCLFAKLGFTAKRRLLVVRRPPGKPETLANSVETTELNMDGIREVLRGHDAVASWLDETPSLLNAGNVEGLRVQTADGMSGSIVYCSNVFQLSHLVVDAPNGDPELARATLVALHNRYPRRDTKLENLPADDPLWGVYQSVGYSETFSRVEMIKAF